MPHVDDVHELAIADDEGLIAFSGHFAGEEDDDPRTAKIFRLRDGKRASTIAPPRVSTFVKEFLGEQQLLVEHYDRRGKKLVERDYHAVWDAASGRELVRIECGELLGTVPGRRMVFLRGWDDEIALVDLRAYLGKE